MCEFLSFGLIAVGTLLAYPFAMTNVHRARLLGMRNVSFQASIGAFADLILVICLYEGPRRVLIRLTVDFIGGLLNRMFAVDSGVPFMGYCAAVLTVPAIIALS